MLETKKILITVKAYPVPSQKYIETVCTAGIDIENKKWIRLYPIPYRYLEKEKKFKKYDIIQAGVKKATGDNRPESYNVDRDSIQVIDSLGTKNDWQTRKDYLLPMLDKSMCNIEKKRDEDNISLGIFKPIRNIDLSWEKTDNEWRPGVEESYSQLLFFDEKKEALEKIPYNFRFKYFCNDEPNCNGHKQKILDWEIGEAYRKWKNKYGQDNVLSKIKEKWQDQLFGKDRDSYLIVGNQSRYKTFMILGVFWPPKKK